MKWICTCSIVLSILLSQCGPAKMMEGGSSSDNITLENTYWKLTELNGLAITNDEDAKKEIYILLKSQDNTLSAFAGCNGVGGKYELMTGNRVRISNMISTMMACPELETENAFKKVLETVDNYTINGDQLSLNKARMAPLARFKAIKKQPPN